MASARMLAVLAAVVSGFALALVVVSCTQPEATPQIAPTVAPTATATPEPTAIPTIAPSATPLPDTPTPVPTPTATSTPVPTPTLTPTPAPPLALSVVDVDATEWTLNADGTWTVELEITADVPDRLLGEGFVAQVTGCGDSDCHRDARREFVVSDDGLLTLTASIDLEERRQDLIVKVDLRWPSQVADVADSMGFVAAAPLPPALGLTAAEFPVRSYQADGTSEIQIRLPLPNVQGLRYSGEYSIMCAGQADCGMETQVTSEFANDTELIEELPAGNYLLNYAVRIPAYSNGIPLNLNYEPVPFQVREPSPPEVKFAHDHLGNLIAHNGDGTAQAELPFFVQNIGLWTDQTVALWLSCDGVPCDFGVEYPIRFEIDELETPTDKPKPGTLGRAAGDAYGVLALPRVPWGEHQFRAELLYSLQLDPARSDPVEFAIQPRQDFTTYRAQYSVLGYNNDGTATVNVNGRIVEAVRGVPGMSLETRLDASLVRFEDIGNFNVQQGRSTLRFVSHGGDDIQVNLNVPPPSFTLGPHIKTPEAVSQLDAEAVFEALRSQNRWYGAYIALGGMNLAWWCGSEGEDFTRVRYLKGAEL